VLVAVRSRKIPEVRPGLLTKDGWSLRRAGGPAVFTALSLMNGGAPGAGPLCTPAVGYDRGRTTGALCVESAGRQGFTVVDLSDDWAPFVFSETVEAPQSYRSTYVALANEQAPPSAPAAAVESHLELFGIFPSLRVMRARLLDEDRHRCHDAVDAAPLAALQVAPLPHRPRSVATRLRLDRAGIRVVQAHLRCERLLDARARDGSHDRWTRRALRAYQRKQMVFSRPGALDVETRAALLTSSRELDFRALLRVLRERVVDAAGLIEDGSARGAWEPILGRFLDPAEYRRVPGSDAWSEGAPDLISRATESAARALGWWSPQAAVDFFRAQGIPPVATPARVALPLPPPPSYHGQNMELRAVIDRGDAAGRARPHRRRPTLVLFARHQERDIPLVRWPTTTGGWQNQQLPDGTIQREEKKSPLGRWYWRDLLVAPAWLPPPTTPDRELVITRSGRAEINLETMGPGYRSAYGLVALLHHRGWPARDGGPPTLVDAEQIRTHGSGNYRSVLRGESHGCHRLFNHLALRLGSFLLQHRAHTRHGVVAGRYVRRIDWGGQELMIELTTRGYRYELTPPVPLIVRPRLERVEPAGPPSVVSPLEVSATLTRSGR